MSEIQRLGRLAEHELQLTSEAYANHRTECLEKAVKLAAMGERDQAYTHLLMAVAIDKVRDLVHGHVDSAIMDKASEQARHPNN